jgi:hypothetical protein
MTIVSQFSDFFNILNLAGVSFYFYLKKIFINNDSTNKLEKKLFVHKKKD